MSGSSIDCDGDYSQLTGKSTSTLILAWRTVLTWTPRENDDGDRSSAARAQLVDPSLTRWYHCVTRCVRRAFLLGEGDHNRKEWLENRLEKLAGIFGVSVGGFSVMNNYLHLLLRLDPEVARAWSDDEVVRRWGRLFPPRDKSRQPSPVTEHWVQWRLADPQWVANARERLQNLGWFMKCLKEPLSRLANRQDKTRGTFFEGRFRSVAVLDEESRCWRSVSTFI